MTRTQNCGAPRTLCRAASATRSPSTPSAPATPNCGTSRGGRYVDFASGISVLNTGHAASEGQGRACSSQLEQLHAHRFPGHAVRELHRPRGAPERARARAPHRRRRSSSPPAPRRSRTPSRSRAFTPSARQSSPSRGGFHGRTLACISLTGKVQPYKAGFGPMLPEIYHLPYPDALPRRHRRALAGSARAAVQSRHRSGARGRHHH